MGGQGSGNFDHGHRPPKRLTVEDCLALDTVEWVRQGVLRPGARRSGTWTWRQYRGGPPGPRPDGADGGRWEVTNSVGYETDAGADPPRARLDYRLTDSAEQLAYAVPLATTRPPRGGPRWWFWCPLAVDGQRCGRRVRKLYLPPGGRYFGCRHCYGLTYSSSQEGHRWDELFRAIARNLGADPRVVRRHMTRYAKQGRRAAACHPSESRPRP